MGEKKLLDGILSTSSVCVWVFVYSLEYGRRFPMWHYVDIHDQLICLTSSLYSQMDPLLEAFSNQAPAPAKPSIFTISNVLFLVNKLQSLTGTNPHMEICLLFPDRTPLFFPQLISHKRIQCITRTRHAHINPLPHVFILGLIIPCVYSKTPSFTTGVRQSRQNKSPNRS